MSGQLFTRASNTRINELRKSVVVHGIRTSYYSSGQDES